MVVFRLVEFSKFIGCFCLKGQYHGRSMGDIMIFGQNSLTLNFEHCYLISQSLI